MKKLLSILLVLGFVTVVSAKGHGKHFKEMDADKNGKISLDEFKNAKGKWFEKIDANKDGTLSKEEVQKHHESRKGKGKGKHKGKGKDKKK